MLGVPIAPHTPRVERGWGFDHLLLVCGNEPLAFWPQSIVSAIHRTLPSHIEAFTPPGWKLLGGARTYVGPLFESLKLLHRGPFGGMAVKTPLACGLS